MKKTKNPYVYLKTMNSLLPLRGTAFTSAPKPTAWFYYDKRIDFFNVFFLRQEAKRSVVPQSGINRSIG
jgi:hypothetical protein